VTEKKAAGQMNKTMEGCEVLKVWCVGSFGFITQLTSLDLFFKASIGFLTCCYLTLKIVGWFIDRKKKGETNE
jgi:hypothetical protein